jgi:hypothetical protein
MVSFFYKKAKQGFAGGTLSWTGSIHVFLIDTALYTADENTDATLANVPALARVAESGDLTGLDFTNGVLDADDPIIASVAGATVEALLFAKIGASDALSPLFLYTDNFLIGGASPPFTPTGSPVDIVFSNGIYKIAAL